MPLLNYLLAASFTREGIKFDQNTNLNSIYENLLISVYERQDKWADQQHPVLKNISQEEFFRILEEIALATWHGNGRKVTVKEIENQCKVGRLTELLEKFQEKAKEGVADLLVAFYFRKTGIRDTDGSETFEFTHKSFGEYLTSKRLVRGIKKIYLESKRKEESYDEGWVETDALKHWIELTGKSAIDIYLLEFVRREIAIKDNEPRDAWQKTLAHLISFILRNGIPMEMFVPRLNFKEELRQSRNSEESLLAVANACSLVTEIPVELNFPDVFSFGKLIAKIQENALFENNIISDVLSQFDLSHCILKFANFSGFNLQQTIFVNANLTAANLSGADLTGSILSNANLSGTNLEEADLTEAVVDNADFSEANINNAVFIDVDVSSAKNLDLNELYYDDEDEETHFQNMDFQAGDFRGKDFSDADLVSCDFERADFYMANLRNANFENADFRGAKLDGAIGIKKKIE
ncbi:MAG TPA: pentapeptide repeat-containing protein [Pyrinomonadaceae bacterium]|nr:pentapeptide repeat-containing protein [Pyrinomonadaceae bacterium]